MEMTIPTEINAVIVLDQVECTAQHTYQRIDERGDVHIVQIVINSEDYKSYLHYGDEIIVTITRKIKPQIG